MQDDRLLAFAGLHVEGRARAVRGPEAATFPALRCIVDAAVEPAGMVSALVNVIINAIDASTEGCTVSLATVEKFIVVVALTGVPTESAIDRRTSTATWVTRAAISLRA